MTTFAFENRDGGLCLLKDGKPYLTPLKNKVILDDLSQNLEKAIKGEGFEKALPFLNTVFDHLAAKRNLVEDQLLSFLFTDTLLIWDEGFSKLYDQQSETFRPLISIINGLLNVHLKPAQDLSKIDIDNNDLIAFKSFFRRLSLIHFGVLYFASEQLSSVLLGFLLMNKKIPLERAMYASLLEEKMQQDKWGVLEEHHEKNQKMYEELENLILFV